MYNTHCNAITYTYKTFRNLKITMAYVNVMYNIHSCPDMLQLLIVMYVNMLQVLLLRICCNEP